MRMGGGGAKKKTSFVVRFVQALKFLIIVLTIAVLLTLLGTSSRV